MDDNKHLEPAPEPTAFDYSVAVAKVAGYAVPPLGGAVALFDLITAPIRGNFGAHENFSRAPKPWKAL